MPINLVSSIWHILTWLILWICLWNSGDFLSLNMRRQYFPCSQVLTVWTNYCVIGTLGDAKRCYLQEPFVEAAIGQRSLICWSGVIFMKSCGEVSYHWCHGEHYSKLHLVWHVLHLIWSLSLPYAWFVLNIWNFGIKFSRWHQKIPANEAYLYHGLLVFLL